MVPASSAVEALAEICVCTFFMNLCVDSDFSLWQLVTSTYLGIVLFWRGNAGNVYHMMVLIRCFCRPLSTLYRKGRSRVHYLRVNPPRCLSVLVDADVNNIVTCKHPRTTSNPLGQTEPRATSILQEAPKKEDLLSEELFASSLIICEMRRRLLLMEPCPSNSCTALLGLCSFFCWEGLLEEQGSFKYWD